MPYHNRNESHRHRRHTYGWPTLPGVRSASTGNLSSTVRARELDIHVDIDVSHIAGGEPHCRRFRYQAALRRASGQNPLARHVAMGTRGRGWRATTAELPFGTGDVLSDRS